MGKWDVRMHNGTLISVHMSVESSAVHILKVSAVSTSAAVVSWNGVPGATGYRLAWGPTQGDGLSLSVHLFCSHLVKARLLLQTRTDTFWCFFSEFVGRDRPRQLALNSSTVEYQLKNVAHDTEYVLSLYVLFGSVVGPGISTTFKTCECTFKSSCKFHHWPC